MASPPPPFSDAYASLPLCLFASILLLLRVIVSLVTHVCLSASSLPFSLSTTLLSRFASKLMFARVLLFFSFFFCAVRRHEPFRSQTDRPIDFYVMGFAGLVADVRLKKKSKEFILSELSTLKFIDELWETSARVSSGCLDDAGTSKNSIRFRNYLHWENWRVDLSEIQ